MIKLISIAVILVIGIYIGSAGALTLTSTFDADSKLTKIYVQPLCTALKITSISNVNCEKEILTDFDKNDKTKVVHIDTAGIKRSIKLNEKPVKPPITIKLTP